MIQDIQPHFFNNQYQKMHATMLDYVLVYQHNSILIKQMGELPTFKDCELTPNETNTQYLFSVDQNHYFLYKYEMEVTDGFEYVAVHTFMNQALGYDGFVAVSGFHLFNWYENNKYCGKCGKRLVHDDKERMLRCLECGNLVYPKLAPAVIVGIIKDNQLLLTRYSGRAFKRYALVAGFAEVGETIEATVKREVMEEVGLHVTNIRYYKSQPWGLSESLLMGFYADVEGDATITLDQEELEFAAFFTKAAIPTNYSTTSLTGEMIDNFINSKHE